MTKAVIRYQGKDFIISERSVTAKNAGTKKQEDYLFSLVDRFHYSHTPITDTLNRIKESKIIDFEFMEDLGGLPDASFNDDFE